MNAVRPFSVEVEGLSVRFGGRQALEAVDLRLEPGEVAALVGPSGAGKTTLLRCLNATVRPNGGRVAVGGVAWPERGARDTRRTRSLIGYVPQDLGLLDALSVHQNVTAGRFGTMGLARALRLLVAPPRAHLDEIALLLADLGLSGLEHEPATALSQGQRQRVALARALFQRPRLLLADEPVSSLDPARAEDVLRLLVDRARGLGCTLLVSLHNIQLARSLFPRIVGLRDGRVAFDLPSPQVDPERLAPLYRLEGG